MALEINSLFKVHKLNSIGLDNARFMAEDFSVLMNHLAKYGVNFESREGAIVKTKLEEACFYAKKSMAMNPANQES